MFPFPHMMDFFAHEFAGLRRSRFTLTFIFVRSFQRFLLRHIFLSSLYSNRFA